MFRNVDGFLRYFEGVNKRAMRDVAALPPEADGWRPEIGEGEKAWSINTLVGHMAGSRLYFASAYSGSGWISPEPPDVSSRAKWLPALEASFNEFKAKLAGTPDDWLDRRVDMIDTAATLPGWRVLSDDDGTRHPPSQPDRHLRGHERLGCPGHLQPQRREDRYPAGGPAREARAGWRGARAVVPCLRSYESLATTWSASR